MMGSMDNLEPITPYGALNPQDVFQSLKDLASGTYLAADLYQRYAKVAADAGRTPAHPRTFGRELAQRGCISRRHQHRAAWTI